MKSNKILIFLSVTMGITLGILLYLYLQSGSSYEGMMLDNSSTVYSAILLIISQAIFLLIGLLKRSQFENHN